MLQASDPNEEKHHTHTYGAVRNMHIETDIHRESPCSSRSSSPRSPIRSPSWMHKYRESPPRSPRGMSPPISPRDSMFTYGEMSGTNNMGDDEHILVMRSMVQNGDPAWDDVPQTDYGLTLPEKPPPPKPLRMHEIQKSEERYDILDDEDDISTHSSTHSLDLATYAAAVASDTAQLTNLSVSPVNLPQRQIDQAMHLDHGFLEVSPETDTSISPPSPNYYEDGEDVDIGEPTPKTIDDQGTKRQKIRPPASDWSPVTDLSPIIDVSPSVEMAEQADMLAQQASMTAERHRPRIPVPPPPKMLGEEGEEITYTLHSGLKRYDNFEDISKLCAVNGEGADKQVNPERTEKSDEPIIRINIPKDSVKNNSSSVPVQAPVKEPSVKKMGAYTVRTISQSDDEEETPRRPSVAELRRSFEKDDEKPPEPPRRQIRTLPAEPKPQGSPPIPPKPARERIQMFRMGRSAGSVEEKPPERTDSLEQDSGKKSPKSRPQPLRLKNVESEEDNIESVSPHYRVLRSPPDKKTTQSEFMDTSLRLSPDPEDEDGARAYIYPTPEPSPDRGTSPPKPQSPSQQMTELGSPPHMLAQHIPQVRSLS